MAFENRLRRIPEGIRKSLTYDQGKERATHDALAANTRSRVYFADPHSPWQRATMENTDGCSANTCQRVPTSLATLSATSTSSQRNGSTRGPEKPSYSLPHL